jgi:hypothetical protein
MEAKTKTKNKINGQTINETSGFFQTGPQTYYVNSSEIMTIDKLLCIGHDYILMNFDLEDGLKAYYVKLTIVRFINDWVHIHLEDNQKYGNYLLHIPFQVGQPETTYFLMDVDSLILELNTHFYHRRKEIIQKISSIEPFANWDRLNGIIWEEIVGLQGKS